MTRKNRRVLAGAVALCMSLSAFANQTELHVGGVMSPSSCTPVVENSGVAFGDIPSSELRPVGDTALEAKAIHVNITCNGATRFALKATDLDASSVSTPAPGRFGLGMQGDGHRNGYFSLTIAADRMPEPWNQLMSSVILDGTGSWTMIGSAAEAFDARKIYGFTAETGLSPASFKKLDMVLLVGLTIAEGLDVSAPVDLKGEALLDLVYL